LFSRYADLLKYKQLVDTETVKLSVCDNGSPEKPYHPIFKTEYLYRFPLSSNVTLETFSQMVIAPSCDTILVA
jgi:hypothetical protein